MTETRPDLESRVEHSLTRVLKDAFPGVPVHSLSDPGERAEKCIGVKVELGSENPIGTSLFDVSIEVKAQNLDAQQGLILANMIGTAHAAKETLSTHSARQFAMPRGQAVEMIGAPRTAEDEKTRIITYSLSATIQPL
jgi:hypothetical protein